jgi:osmotically-inducible protein OsmY
MAQDRWNDNRYGDEPQWGERQGRSPESRDWAPQDYDRYEEDPSRKRAARWPEDDEARYRPFGDTGPISTRGGAYSGEGRPYGVSGRYNDLSPNYREFAATQQRRMRRDFERDYEQEYGSDRYTPNAREGRDEEPRSWWDRTQDEVSSWFGDENARRRREWDERQADLHGEHRGRGPKGYKRSEGRITEDVNDRLTDDPFLDASDIQVKVKDTEVTLDGWVVNRQDKRRAEDLADSVSGVSHVQNNLRVRPRGDATASDITL